MRFLFCLFLALCLALTVQGRVWAVIDTFNTLQPPLIFIVANGDDPITDYDWYSPYGEAAGTPPFAVFQTTTDCLGGQRDVIIGYETTTASNSVAIASISAKAGTISLPLGYSGGVYFQYDGADNAGTQNPFPGSNLSRNPGIGSGGNPFGIAGGLMDFTFAGRALYVTCTIFADHQCNYYFDAIDANLVRNELATLITPVSETQAIPFNVNFNDPNWTNRATFDWTQVAAFQVKVFTFNEGGQSQAVDTSFKFLNITGYEIAGNVLVDCNCDSTTDSFVSGSTVTLQNPTTSATLGTTTTDANGDFFFYGRTEGTYRVCISSGLSRCAGQTQCRDVTLANLIDPAKLIFVTTVASTLSVPPSVTVQCGDCITPTCLGFASTTGCSGTTQVNTFTDVPTVNGCTTTIQRRWTANSQTLTQTITVQDTLSPVIDTQAQSLSFPCNSITTTINAWVTSNGGAQATDCSAFAWSNNWNNVGPGQCGTVTVTFTARDVCGNPDSRTTATYTTTDTTNPTITTQAQAQTVECSAKNNNVQTALTNWLNRNADAVATDNCSASVTWTNNYAGLADPLDPLSCLDFVDVTFTATDSCGRAATTVGRFTTDDTQSAVYTTVPQNINRECAGTTADLDNLNSWISNNGNSLYTDACSTNNLDIVVTNDYSARPFNGCSDQFTVTFSIQDACGNAPTQATATWRVTDSVNPVITTQASPSSVQCDPALNDAQFDTWLNDNGGARATDACTAVTWTDNSGATPFGCSANAVVIFTASDACGRSVTSQSTFTVIDTTPAFFTTNPQSTQAECDSDASQAYQDWLDNFAGAVGSDVCDDTNLVYAHGTPALVTGCNRANVVGFTVADRCGNASPSVTAQFLVVDSEDPVITVPGSDLNIECNASTNQQSYNTWLSTRGGAQAVDDCTGVTWTNDGAVTLIAQCSFVRDVTFTASDGCGHSATTVLSASIQDTQSPTLNQGAIDQDIQCNTISIPTSASQYSTWVAANGFAVASDTCGAVTWTNDAPAVLSGVDPCFATATITFTASDPCGRSVQTTADFTIQDTTAPVLIQGAQTTSTQCDPSVNDNQFLAWVNNHGGAQVQDACSAVTWTTSVFDSPFGCDSETVVFTADDGCGQTVQTTATFSIIDTVNPTINPLAATVTVECDGAGNIADYNNYVATRGGAQASDVCATSLTWSNDALPAGPVGCGSQSIQFTVVDSCGGRSVTTGTYRVADTRAPVINPPAADQSAECDAVNNPPAIAAWVIARGGAQATDSCYATGSLVWSNNYSGLVPLPCGSVATVTFSVTDPCAQVGRTTASFLITDSFPPQITSPATSIVLECNPATNNADTLAWVNARGSASATDNCSSVSWSNDFVATPDPCTGPYVVGFNADDGCGNRVTTLASVTIVDSVPPEFANFPPDVAVTCDEVTDSSMTGIPGFTDSCFTADVIRTESDAVTVEPFERLCPGDTIITRTWRITDACGNFSERDQLIVVGIPQGPCIPQPCIPCDEQPLLCCASSMLPVPCIPVPCVPVDCTHTSCNSVPCIPVVCGNGAPPPFQDDDDTIAPSPRPQVSECEPIYIYVFDDDDGVTSQPVYTVSQRSSSASTLTVSLFSLFIALFFFM